MLTAQEEISELPYLAMYSILKAAKATGDTRMAQQVYEDAALHYTRALEWGIKSGHLTDSKVAALRLARSNAHLLSGRAEEARKDAEEAIRLRPLCPKGWLLKGRSLQHLRAFPEAAEAFATAYQCPQTGEIAQRAALPPKATLHVKYQDFHKVLVKKLERVQARRREAQQWRNFIWTT